MLARSWRAVARYLIPERWWTRTWWIVWSGSTLLVVYSLVNTLTVANYLGVNKLTFWDVAQNTLGNFFLVLHGWTNLYLLLAAQLGSRHPFDVPMLMRVRHRKGWLAALGITLIAMTGVYSFLLVLASAIISFPWVTFAPNWSNFFPLYFHEFSMTNMQVFLTLPAPLTVLFTWLWLTLGWFFLASLVVGVAWFTGSAVWGFLAGWLMNYSVLFVQGIPSVWRFWPHRFLYFWSYGSTASIKFFLQGVLYWVILLAVLWGCFLILSKKWEDPWVLSAPIFRFRVLFRSGLFRVIVWQWRSMFREPKWWGVVALVNGIHGYIIGQRAFSGSDSLGRVSAFLWAYGGPPLGSVDWWSTVIWLFQGVAFLLLLSFWLAPAQWNMLTFLLPRLKSRRRWLLAMWVALALASVFYVTWSLLFGGIGLLLSYGEHSGWLKILQIFTAQGGFLHVAYILQLWLLLVFTQWLYGLGMMGWVLWRPSYASGVLFFSFLYVVTWLVGLLDPPPVWSTWFPPAQSMLLRHAPWSTAFPTFTLGFSLKYIAILSLLLMAWAKWRLYKVDLIPESLW